MKTLNDRVNSLDARVSLIENELKRVKIGGVANLMVQGANRRDENRLYVQDQNGFLRSNTARRALLGDIRVLHDLDLNIKARLSETATVDAVINFGNYLPTLNGIASFSGVRSDILGQQVNQDQQTSIYKLVVDVPAKVGGIGNVGLQVGRLPIQFTP